MGVTVGQRTKHLDDRTWADRPGRVPLSRERLRAFHPSLFGWRAVVLDLTRPKGEKTREECIEYFAEALWYGDAQPAVVINASPLRIAAYSEELDAVVMLGQPPWVGPTYRLERGQRLLSVNTYLKGKQVAPDLEPGPKSRGYWTNFQPLIAELLSEDGEAIWGTKSLIGDAEWERTQRLGERALARWGQRVRDGRPMFVSWPAK